MRRLTFMADLVSILVLVDQSLGEITRLPVHYCAAGFNPCFSGSVSRSELFRVIPP